MHRCDHGGRSRRSGPPRGDRGDRLGRVTNVDDKPDRPTTGVVATEIFVYDPTVLITLLEQLHSELTERADPDETGLGDFGDHLLPRLVERGSVYEYRMSGYWKDVGRPDTYACMPAP